LLYGIYFVYFRQSFRVILSSRDHPRNWWHVLASFGIFLFATAHMVIVFSRGIQAFTIFRDNPGPVAYFYNLKLGLEVSQASTQVAVTFLGDCMVIWRVWIVYSRNYLAVIVPLLCLLGTTTAGIASVVVIGQASSPDSTPTFYVSKLETWLPAFFSMTFGTSILSTILIAIRLSLAQRHAEEYSTRRTISQFMSVQRILIESASLYSGNMLIYLATYLGKTNYSIIFGDMVSPLIGIAFSLITIRVKDALDDDNNTTTKGPSYLSTVRFAIATKQPTATNTTATHDDDKKFTVTHPTSPSVVEEGEHVRVAHMSA